MPVTSEQMDELIRQMKISNQLLLTSVVHDFAIRPANCRTEEEVKEWNKLFDETVSLAKYLDI